LPPSLSRLRPALSIGGVTFSADGLIEIDSDYAGGFNTRGDYHITNHGNGPNAFRFDFSTPTDAFAFLWGAADYDWTLQAFGASGLLDSINVTPTHGSNNGDYVGIAASGIEYATLTLSDFNDYVFIDNFTYNESQILFGDGQTTSVPEPGTMALLGMGVVGFAAARRRKQRA